MPIRNDAWPNGTPAWVDLTADDPAAAAAFYADLLGWSFHDPGPAAGGYLLAHKDDRAVAGIGPSLEAEQPSSWSTYFAADDADATATAVLAAGGRLRTEPFDVMGNGRMFLADALDGSTFGVWQAGTHIGAELYNEPGALAWNELHSRDLEAARTFYGAVFGYEYDDMSSADFTYYTFTLADGGPVGGMGPAKMLPAGVGSVWLSWFSVASCEWAVTTVARLGGSILMLPTASPFGRMAVVTGPQGETFGLIELSAVEA